MKRLAWIAVLPLLAAACGGGTSPGGKPDTGLDITAELPDLAPPDPGVEASEEGDRDLGGEEASLPDPEPDVPEEVAPDVPPPPPCEEGRPCDDGDPCTHTDRCKDLVCKGVLYKCNDAKSCTHDVCDGYGGCRYPVREDRCLIAGACFEDGAPNPDNPCLACVSPASQEAWTADDGASCGDWCPDGACGDGKFCTIGDFCMGGACVGGLPNPCDDQNWCTDDGCSEQTGCTHVANARACSDGNACTIGDVCENKKCKPGATQVACDDHNPCTNDKCDPAVGCVNAPNTNPCDDGSVCTLDDRCQDGACVGGSQKNCADTNPCTDDTCHKTLGCRHPDNRAWCDDGNACTDGDQCMYGACQAGPGLPDCNDEDPCTADSCDPKKGCVHAPASGAPCEDGDPCTLADFCEAGKCKSSGTKVNCDDQNPCTSDGCDETGKCFHLPNDLPCDDQNPCTVGDVCALGACQPGGGELPCADDKVCTDDACVPPIGCVHTPNNAACTDGDACSMGDRCMSGVCVPGNLVASCDDANPCTYDACKPDQGCVFTPDEGRPCDDGNPCTVDDECGLDGTCQGLSNECDDGNRCTREICLGGGQCGHELIDTPECKPEIVVTYPPRGAWIKGPPDTVTVTGRVTSTGGAVTQFTINDTNVAVAADGSFSWPMTPTTGTNFLVFRASNQAGGLAKGVRGFVFGHQFYPADPATVSQAGVTDGIAVFLGKTVFDDNDTSNADDFATIIYLLVKGTDIASLIPDPLAVQSVGWCTATIRGKNIKYGDPQIDLYPVNGGLHARVRFTNFSMNIDANMSGFACPSASGTVKASAITVELDLLVSVPAPGEVKVTLANQQARVDGLDINLDGVLGFLLNWLIGLFSNTIADQLESMIVGQIDQFAGVLEDALKSLAIHQVLTIPPLLGAGKTVDVTLDAVVSRADFDAYGGVLGLKASAVTAKGVPYSPLGSVARSGCLQPGNTFHFIEKNELEFGIFDDLLNEILYAVWYGGTLEMDIDVASLGGDIDLSKYGVTDLVVHLSFMLPPTMTDCTPDEHLSLRIADIRIDASLVMGGQPIVMEAYASADARASVGVVDKPTGPELSLAVENIDLAEVEVASATGGAAGKYALTGLIEAQLLPLIFDQLGGGFLASFPIPEIDLGGLVPGVPAGTSLSISPQEVYRFEGYSVLSGDVR